MRFSGGLVIVLIFTFVGVTADLVWGQKDDLDLQRLSEEMKKSEKETRYEAEQTVYDFGSDRVRASRFRVYYAYPFRKRVSIDGPEENRSILLEDGQHQWNYFPSRRIVIKEPLRQTGDMLSPDLSSALDLLLKNYKYYVRGPVPVNGTMCRIIEFLPNCKDRPGREIWLEDKRKIPVRVYISYPDGRPAYRSELDKIRWDASIDGDMFRLEVPKNTKVYEIKKHENLSREKAEELMRRPMRLPLFVPLGYAPYNIILRIEGYRKRLQVVYTDGLSSFSVFEEWPEPEGPESAEASKDDKETVSKREVPTSGQPPSGTAPIPHTYRYGLLNVITLDHGGQRTVFVGDILADSLREIAHSLRRKDVTPESAPSAVQETEPKE